MGAATCLSCREIAGLSCIYSHVVRSTDGELRDRLDSDPSGSGSCTTCFAAWRWWPFLAETRPNGGIRGQHQDWHRDDRGEASSHQDHMHSCIVIKLTTETRTAISSSRSPAVSRDDSISARGQYVRACSQNDKPATLYPSLCSTSSLPIRSPPPILLSCPASHLPQSRPPPDPYISFSSTCSTFSTISKTNALVMPGIAASATSNASRRRVRVSRAALLGKRACSWEYQ